MLSHALVHTYELTIPIFMVVWLVEFSATEALLGVVVAVGYALFGIGALPSGVISDKYGSQNLIAVCLVGMGLSFIILSFATNILMIAVAVCLWGAAASIYHPAGLSLISTAVKDSGSGFAYHGMAGNAGIALGPLCSVVLLWFTDWRAVSLVLAIPAFFAVVYILRADIDEMAAANLASDGSGGTGGPADAPSSPSFFESSKSLFLGGFALVFLVIVFNGLYYRGILTFLPELLADFVTIGGLEDGAGAEQFDGSDFIYVGILMVGILGQYVGGKATDRIPVERGLVAGYACLVVIALLYVPAAESGLIFLVFVSLLLGFCLFALQPMYQVAVAEYSPTDSRGLSYGYTYLAQFGVGAMGAAIVGIILTYSVVASVFFALAAFAVVASAFSVRLLMKR
ncbi:MFS transporter [Natrarchaeobius halalkaliphilus]|nr:MFS transporter [Natrarchaeobius halalkaliphilus]